MNTKLYSHKARRFISVAIIILVIVNVLAVPGEARSSTSLQSYIIQGTNTEVVARLVEKYGGTVTSRLDIIQGVGASLSPMSLSNLRGEPAITAMTPNHLVHATGGGAVVAPTDYPEVVGANVVWQQGVTGAGVTVAVVDTGLAWHPGLLKNINGRTTNRIVGWVDFVDGWKIPNDPNGHGTHIAGIIANTQKDASNQWGGVAPGVRLVGVRVLNMQGDGNYEKVIQGIQWVISHKDQYSIRVMNLSLVSPAQSPYWADPLNQAVMQAWAAGITVVVAAGNEGPGPMSIGVPGNVPYVITVGAFTDNYTPLDWSDDYLTEFSSAGPTLDGFVKPDVLAPGAHMVSTMMPYAYLAWQHEANKVTAFYFSMAGTSQATAVVSGEVALILAQHPELTPNQVKFRLMTTSFIWIDPVSTDALYSMWQQGFGRVNAPDAVFADISGEANLGMDIQADLAGTTHYEGYSYYDETTGTFRLSGGYGTWAGGYGTWAGGYGTWAGGYGTWAGGYGTWAGGYGTWAGGYGTWAGGYGTWAGGYGTWAGGYGTWAGGYGTWAGGYGTWAGGYGTWAGNEPWAGSVMSDPTFVANFLAGVAPDASSATTTINNWVDEP